MSHRTIVDVTMRTPDDWFEVPLRGEPGARRWAKRLAAELDAPRASGLERFLREEQRIIEKEPSTVIGLVHVPYPASGVVTATLSVQMVQGEPGDAIEDYLDGTLARLNEAGDLQGIRDVKQWRSLHAQGEFAAASFSYAVSPTGTNAPGTEQRAHQVDVLLFPTGLDEMVELTFATPHPDHFEDVIELVQQFMLELRVITEVA